MNGNAADVVIVGAGQAGGECAANLRMVGYEDGIVLVGAESDPPYSRPPLSKAYLRGEEDESELYLRPADFYPKYGIDLITGSTVVQVDRDNSSVTLANGSKIAFGTLVFATGSRPRRLNFPGVAEAKNVYYVRSRADVDRMRQRFRRDARMLVVGGGYIGLEIAAVARGLGMDVTVIEVAPRLLSRVAPPVVSRFFQRLHAEAGTAVHLDVTISDFDLDSAGEVRFVRTSEGEFPVDLVVVGVGIVPNTELAQECGLQVDDGIVVDEFCTTSDPAMLAIGDCSKHPCFENGGLRRLESVPNAVEQARTAALSIHGTPSPYRSVPWFWSEQYDVKFQMVGMPFESDDIVIRGNPDSGRTFSVFFLREGRVRGAHVASNPAAFAAAKKLIARRIPVDPGALSDEAIDLRSLITPAASTT